MTVKELIEELKNWDQSIPVKIRFENEDYDLESENFYLSDFGKSLILEDFAQ